MKCNLMKCRYKECQRNSFGFCMLEKNTNIKTERTDKCKDYIDCEELYDTSTELEPNHPYSPNSPWEAPGMNYQDFI